MGSVQKLAAWLLAGALLLTGCAAANREQQQEPATTEPLRAAAEGGLMSEQVLDGADGEIHYSYYLPEDYDPDHPYPLVMAMPGYGEIWFGEDSSGSNLNWNGFRNWRELDEPMIVVSAQLTDWGEKSARQAIELTEYFIKNFSVDTNRIYAAGYSAGGETMSRAVSMRPDLYAAYLHGASQWDGTYAPLAEQRMAVYIFMGEHDEYYGSQRARDAYDGLHAAYREAGMTEEEISELLILNIPDDDWFNRQGVYNYHGGGNLVFDDLSVLEWITGHSFAAEEDGGTSGGHAEKESDPMETEISQTGWTKAVPAEYTRAARERGSVVRLDYASEDYVRDGAAVTKAAYVYTPYGYDENDTETRYNVLYLMHGWGGRAGEYFDFTGTKNLFDNLIENGDIPPLIIVSATFYNENSSTNFSSSIAEFRQFHRDFEDHLMPAVEGRFHTYARSASQEDLKASRDHRAFGGFSLGSVTTWLQFCYDYDYIRYFLPMSGSCWYYGTYGDFQTEKNVDFIEQLVREENLDERGYFIYHAVGTEDAVKSQTIMQAEEMLDRGDVFTPDHYLFYQKDGGYHDFNAVQEYLYNALPLFFRDEEPA